jgi:hypothetical protein
MPVANRTVSTIKSRRGSFIDLRSVGWVAGGDAVFCESEVKVI